MTVQTNDADFADILGQLTQRIANVDASNFVPPSRQPSTRDIILGPATDHIKTLRTARAKLKQEIESMRQNIITLIDKIQAMLPDTVASLADYSVWEEHNPSGKKIVEELYRLDALGQPMRAIEKMMTVLLNAEVARAYPEIYKKRNDDKIPRINSNWDVVFVDPPHYTGISIADGIVFPSLRTLMTQESSGMHKH